MVKMVALKRGKEIRGCSLSITCGHSKMAAVYQPGGDPSPECDHNDTLILESRLRKSEK